MQLLSNEPDEIWKPQGARGIWDAFLNAKVICHTVRDSNYLVVNMRDIEDIFEVTAYCVGRGTQWDV